MRVPDGQRKRTFQPKRRSGCITCKRRRVKCDEAKPACNKCVKHGTVCEGYPPPKPPSLASRPLVHIAPRNSLQPTPLFQAPESPLGVRFWNQTDYAYFQSFREKTTSVLVGPFQDTLWTRVILQACHDEVALRALVMSIGALQLSYGDARADLRCISGRTPEAHRLYALERYNKAIAGVQKIAQSGDQGAVRKTLVASMLIYCFENMYSGPDAAISHLISALRYMSRELSRYRAYSHLRTASPTPDLEDELVAAFVRLDGGIIGRPDTWGTTRYDRRFILKCDFSEAAVPAAFADIVEARNYLEQFDFVALPEVTEIWAAALGGQQAEGPVTISRPRLAVCKQMSLNHQLWLAAYQPIFRSAEASRAAGGPFVAEYTLLVKALGTVIAAQIVWSSIDNENPEDPPWLSRDMIRDSESVLSLAEIISAEPDFSRGFTWHCNLVPAVFAVMMLGPTVGLRRRALDMMKSFRPRRENTWDSTSLAMIGEGALQMCQTDEVSYFRHLKLQDPE